MEICSKISWRPKQMPHGIFTQNQVTPHIFPASIIASLGVDGMKTGASGLIDKYIAGLADWRGKMLSNIRKIIIDADPEITEEWKWMGSPCWSHDGLVAVANAHKDKVKLTFAQGASLPDPNKFFNAGLGGNRWRAVDLYKGDGIDERALKNIIRAAVAHNHAGLRGESRANSRKIRPKVHKK